MEIEVGDYVRFEDGKIERVTYQLKEFIDEHISKSENNRVEFLGKIKHSKNIIDLIEVGDYVNGYRVVAIMEDMETGEIHLEMTSDYTNEIIGDCTIYNDDINSIVTHEQFASIEYKVEEE